MLASLHQKRDGITRFITKKVHGRWVATKEKDGNILEIRVGASFREAADHRGMMINEFWGNNLN